ncbi:MFS transporter [Parapedobacter indicus]|uniref:MFS transporter, FSR family, fosmidomycin resistance protein n=1 Tax=Parapedobacter indicus TaxID=1477437 RepID=A0A1I3SJT8_9SPHI|nr:MFS transporter [Parapedobacter indicus]PPK99781.1 FSR family fosmidomycin resistance protein-like MFS transporter [Parapedobacter indicus]SFJ59028.1 MFS transporter, FSR family, fosmidomycin resistance protein [Parapedobacter indicus]
MDTDASATAKQVSATIYPVLFALSFSHLLNDTIQSLIPAIYPIVKDSFHLSFSQIGVITLVFQLSSSLLQPLVGVLTDSRPYPYALPVGMGFSLIGLIMLAMATSYLWMLVAVAFVGAGSSVFHPEASRMAYVASGGRRGFAQSLFQVGGNAGSAIGPLLAAMLIAPFGQFNVIWFSFAALTAIVILYRIGKWYKPKSIRNYILRKYKVKEVVHQSLPRKTVVVSIIVLLVLIFSKYFYLTSLTSYYTFYLIDKFGVSVQHSQLYLFVFLFAVAAGTMIGGPVGDRIGRKYVIWLSILGASPFTLALPYANLLWTVILSFVIGVIIASAFSAILVYAQELLPGNVGMVSGLFFGFAFGMGGIGSAVLGKLADSQGIDYVYHVCAFLPLIGIVAAFLPNLRKRSA